VANEDVIAWNGSAFAMYFDGGDVGLGGVALNGFARLDDTRLLMTFSTAVSLPGVSGTVDDSDIVLFTASSLGEDTAGTFSRYFDGSDVGLTTSAEDIDALHVLADGALLISTSGAVSVPGVSGSDEDILRFAPSSLGNATSGTWSLHFDGSDVGLTATAEDVDALCVSGAGPWRLSTTGSFSVQGASGDDDDVVAFTPASLGTTTTGVFEPGLVLDGSTVGLGTNDVNAIDCQ
jgi:hypothetical protein